MESRMDKYYSDNDITLESRSKKNENLYKDIPSEISDLDSLPVPDNSNVIDINGLKNIISSRDEYRKANGIKESTNDSYYEEKRTENKVYDINVLLETAKKRNPVGDMPEKIRSTNYLSELEEEDIPNNDEALELSDPIVKDSKQSSNTDSLPLDILADLKGTEGTVVTDPIVKDEVTMVKKIKDGETFYSGSFSFSKKDFDDDNMDDSFIDKKKHTGLKILFLILGLLVLGVAGYLIITNYIL